MLPLEPVAVEFFAGIGLARMGLERAGFRVGWSNDIEPSKARMYERHFNDPSDSHPFSLADIREVEGNQLPESPRLAWASSPCVDVSLAGARAGMRGERSSTFFEFTRVLSELDAETRPDVLTLENVVGLATSHSGEDLAAAITEMNNLGYSVDVLTLDARWFVPQSRPRLFLVGARNPPPDHPDANPELRPDWLQAPFSDPSLRTHRALLPEIDTTRGGTLASIVENIPQNDESWWDSARTTAFEGSLSPVQSKRLDALRQLKGRTNYRTAYRRTRNGTPMWEIRSDEIAGCLRTARGGSSKQALVQAGDGSLRIRWMTPRECARLMGAGDYALTPETRVNQALFGFGDAVCVPVVTWLARNYLMPLVNGELQRSSTPSHLAAVDAG